jgi:hypothetical protein
MPLLVQNKNQSENPEQKPLFYDFIGNPPRCPDGFPKRGQVQGNRTYGKPSVMDIW